MTRNYILCQTIEVPAADGKLMYVKQIINNEPVFTSDIKDAMRLDVVQSIVFAFRLGLIPKPDPLN
ncbi:MAG: hypothetical protein QM726_23025 [Chitinophagaceae bacterium]